MNRTRCLLVPWLTAGLAGSWALGQTPAPEPQNVGTQVEVNIHQSPGVSRQGQQDPDVMPQQQGDDRALREWAGQQPAQDRDLNREQRTAATRPAGAEGQAFQQRGPGLTADPDVLMLDRDGGEIQGYWGPTDSQRRARQNGLAFRDEPAQIGRNGVAFRDSPPEIDPQTLEQYEQMSPQELAERRQFSRQQQFGSRGPGQQFYGFEGTAGADDAPIVGPAGPLEPAINPTRERVSHSWRRSRNLVDDNYIQNRWWSRSPSARDEFKVDRDFYTKEWKVSQPPVVEHPRFHTIYDNEMTQQYYTAWHGSPVLWSANKMTPIPMPQTRNQLFTSRKQLWTYFTGWRGDAISNVPTTFGTPTGPTEAIAGAGAGVGTDFYGFDGDGAGNPRLSEDGNVKRGNQAFYWDDMDLVQAGTLGIRYDSYGYTSPDAGATAAPGVSLQQPTGDVYHNVPRPRDLSIYGVPTPRASEGVRDKTNTHDVYGYRGTDSDRKSRDKGRTSLRDRDHREVYGYRDTEIRTEREVYRGDGEWRDERRVDIETDDGRVRAEREIRIERD